MTAREKLDHVGSVLMSRQGHSLTVGDHAALMGLVFGARDEYAALLRTIEWSGRDSQDAYACPFCEARPPGPLTLNDGKHVAGCELAALLGAD